MKSYNLSDLEDLDTKLAKKIINAIDLLVNLRYTAIFSAGLIPILPLLKKNTLMILLEMGSAFKLVVGAFGGGKTFLYHTKSCLETGLYDIIHSIICKCYSIS